MSVGYIKQMLLMLFKNRISVKILVGILLIGLNGAAIAQTVQIVDGIEQNLRRHVEYLCSPALMGRSTLTGHDVLAARYVDSLFSTYSLKGLPTFVKPTYSQRFNVYNTIRATERLTVGDSVFYFNEDFAYTGKLPPKEKDIEVVFGGVFSEDGFDSMDLKGKALLVFVDKLGLSLFYIQRFVKETGCELVLIANPKDNNDFYKISKNVSASKSLANYSIDLNIENPIRSYMPSSRNNKPIVFISIKLAETILGNSPRDLLDKMGEDSSLNIQLSKSYVTFDLEGDIDIFPTQNVVGYIPAREITQQNIVVGAHLDHLEPIGDRWYPGADDNASGSAVMLEVARLIAADYQNGYRPFRNIVFASFTAEEIGLLGSQHFTLNPLFCVDSTVAFVNIDMVGRPSRNDADKVHLYLNGKNRIESFANILRNVNRDSTLSIDPETLPGSSVYSLSDHYHYDKLGLPSYILTTGLHSDYHRTSDTPEKLSYSGMAKIVDLVYSAIRHFADEGEPWGVAQ